MRALYTTSRWCYYVNEENKPNGYVGHKCQEKSPFFVYRIYTSYNNKIRMLSPFCPKCKTEIDKNLLFQLDLII